MLYDYEIKQKQLIDSAAIFKEPVRTKTVYYKATISKLHSDTYWYQHKSKVLVFVCGGVVSIFYDTHVERERKCQKIPFPHPS